MYVIYYLFCQYYPLSLLNSKFPTGSPIYPIRGGSRRPCPPPAPPNYATASSLISVLTIFIMPAVITEISPRQQPITARDFTGSNLCHTIKKRIALSQRREGNTAFSGPLSNQSACWKQARPYNKVVARWPGIFAVEDHYVIVCLN